MRRSRVGMWLVSCAVSRACPNIITTTQTKGDSQGANSMKIDLRERRDTPVWVTSPQLQESYYRATLPARMTGGTLCNSLKASFDGEAAKYVGPSRAFFSELPFCETLTLYGMGTPTVMPGGITDRKSTRLNSSHANISY